METLVKLKFGNGDFLRGFSQEVNTITIAANLEEKSTEIEIQLPSAPEIPVLYQKWVDKYTLLTHPLRIGFKRKQVTNFSWSECYQECEQFAEDLRAQLNHWLVGIKLKLAGVIQLNSNHDIIFIIDTQEIKCQSTKNILHRLPWREWDYFSGDYYLETALTFNQFQSQVSLIKENNIFRRVKVTSIFGDNQDIDIETDRELIAKLQQRGAELLLLSQPKRPDLVKLWDEPCDILFYSGHSQTDKTNQVGYLQINQEDSLNPEEIKNTFRCAVAKGLKLAIFNSCDGLGLAQQFANLGIPYIIVWREAVPDKIAQDFLKYFLAAFSEGKSLFASFRDARIKIQELTDKQEIEKHPPGVNWLPVICKNSLDAPPNWEDLGGLTGKLPDCPYKGLSAFQEEDAKYFFGRDHFIADLVEAVNTKPLVPVVGASGSGKSSIVFAGLVPHLRKTGKVQIVSFRPGNNPFDALAVALNAHLQFVGKQTQRRSPPVLTDTLPLEKGRLKSRLKELELEFNLQYDEKQLYKFIENNFNSGESLSQRFVLIADQFEELYTLTTEEQRQSFLNTLIYAVRFAPAFTLVLTLRADFYGHALTYRPFSDALQAGIYNLSPMHPQELRAAIENPAYQMKVELEQGLTTKLIDDLGKKPGRLPLLEFTLTQLWQKPNKWYLTHQAYGEIGGLEKALAKYADSILNPLSATDKEKAERMMQKLGK
ncbi:MAG: CHAT domain-containing protein [Cyanobacteria bacterium J06639_18]